MTERHHYQCGWRDGRACDCGVSGPRHWRMDHLPADRPPTPEEFEVWRHAIRGRKPTNPQGETP